MTETGLIVIGVFMVIIFVALVVAVLRWALRINDIMDALFSIYKKLDSIDEQLKKKGE